MVGLLLDFGLVERRRSRKQLVEKNTQTKDVAARIDVESADARLLRTHVGWRSHQFHESGVDRLFRQLLPARRLSQAKVDDFDDRF